MRLLIVVNRCLTSQSLAQVLHNNGAILDQVESGKEAADLVRHYDYDVVVTDPDILDMSGCELVRQIRAAGIAVPVILRAEHDRPQARIKAFNLGADDVVTKSCDHHELFARIQAITRRNKGYSQPSLRCGVLQLNLDSREVLVSNRPVHLTGKEYAILELMVLRKNMVLTKEVFLNHLYGGMDEPEIKIIDVFICKLRRKLADAGAPSIIGTVWGRGYMVRDNGSHPMLTPPAARPRLPTQDVLSA